MNATQSTPPPQPGPGGSASPGGVFALVLLGLVVLGLVIRFWFVALPILVVAALCWWAVAATKARERAAAQAALRAEAAERAHRAELAAAQLQHHLDGLSAADPVYSRLMDDLRAVPRTRPDDRSEVERALADRFVVINQFAHEFAELERAGRPVPDHGATMRGLVEQERAWDARGRTGRTSSEKRPRGIVLPHRDVNQG